MNNKYIIKATGEREEFNPQKLHDSLMRAGASEEATDNIVSQIEKELKDGRQIFTPSGSNGTRTNRFSV